MSQHDPLVSVLFITFNRIELLERTVNSFLANTRYSNLELVVTDDCSLPEVQKQIQGLVLDRVVLSTRNRGLGANTNAGLAACSGKYIVSLQDDWECRGPCEYLSDAVSVFESQPAVGYVPFYGWDRVPQHSRPILGPHSECYFLEQGNGPPIYTDTPHLKSKVFVDCMGKYREGCKMEKTELDFRIRFSQQTAFKSAYFPKYYNTTFVHIGEADSWRGKDWRSRFTRQCGAYGHAVEQRYPKLFRSSKCVYRAFFR